MSQCTGRNCKQGSVPIYQTEIFFVKDQRVCTDHDHNDKTAHAESADTFEN